MSAKFLDRKFDAGGKITDQPGLGKARRVGTEARRLGVTRYSLIKWWLADKPGQQAVAVKR